MFRTKAQKKKMCTHCPIAKASDLVGDSVTLIIIRELMTGSKRFGEIHEVLGGVSTRTVTEKLKNLEENKLVLRLEFKQKPPHVEYSLTVKGKGLKKVVNALSDYGEKFL
ncbi:helix-turn-helix transcriptional regulator [Candidatus Parcubacteria bacterium]|nr:helix-turn-helix transcriptional regulator [Candidatus Parcubacteria bacterium]